ncbi:MAG TPA: hypothetical protein IAA29_08350 [Candidatus Paenibacillus intestinavium]|nr:hypothetical protein [Candidatus Paenibacillus intestinavium]
MRKLFGIVVIVAIAIGCYQWLEQNTDMDLKQQVTTTIQETVDDTALFIKDGLKVESSSSSSRTGEEKLSSKDSEQIVQYIAKELAEGRTAIDITIQGNGDDIQNQFANWLQQAIDVDDYIKYTMESYSYSMNSGLSKSEVALTIVYRESHEMSAEVTSYVKQVIKTLELERYSSFEQVKLIHDWIVQHVQYDQSLTRYTAYEAITEGTTVCQGYALLGYRLYSEAGFDVRIVEGSVNTGEHAWNLVKIEGQWYQIDLTWDDPIGQAEDDVSYKYYLVSDTQLAQDHVWKADYPVATMSYQQLLNEQLATADPASEAFITIQQSREQLGYHMEDSSNTIESYEQMKAMVKSAVGAGETELQFRYTGGEQLVDDINKAFKSLNKSLSYQTSYQEWNKAGDYLVTITIEYR